MRIYSFFLLLFYGTSITAGTSFLVNKSHLENTSIKAPIFSYSNAKTIQNLNEPRTINCPTQLVVIKGKTNTSGIKCPKDPVSYFFNDLLLADTLFWMVGTCIENPDGKLSVEYFASIDPLTESKMYATQEYMTQMNGTEFYGVPITAESVKGIIIPLEIKAGTDISLYDEKNFNGVNYFIGKTLYFNNLYDAETTFLNGELKIKLFNNNPKLITLFLRQWIGGEQTVQYLEALPKSNMVHTSHKTAFLTDKNGIYIPQMVKSLATMYCSQYPSGKCLG